MNSEQAVARAGDRVLRLLHENDGVLTVDELLEDRLLSRCNFPAVLEDLTKALCVGSGVDQFGDDLIYLIV